MPPEPQAAEQDDRLAYARMLSDEPRYFTLGNVLVTVLGFCLAIFLAALTLAPR